MLQPLQKGVLISSPWIHVLTYSSLQLLKLDWVNMSSLVNIMKPLCSCKPHHTPAFARSHILTALAVWVIHVMAQSKFLCPFPNLVLSLHTPIIKMPYQDSRLYLMQRTGTSDVFCLLLQGEMFSSAKLVWNQIEAPETKYLHLISCFEVGLST